MLGEHHSESPRVPSPWDPFLPSPPKSSPSPYSSAALHNGIPKLVPEVEEGNIEYKLKLTNISNARFARLVTQLKWRLLEGGGQAYYELGVADTGALIGLSRADLEESLETLEMMAGEIGASVIVVKEIEVPPTIAAIADKESGYTDPETGEWTRKMRRRPPLAVTALSYDGGECSTSVTTTEVETDFSLAELTDFDDVSSSASSMVRGSGTCMFSATALSAIVHRPIRTNPSRPTAQSSPFIAPIDDDLALFSMEPEPAFEDDVPELDTPFSEVIADDELDSSAEPGSCCMSFAGLEISAVFKPRPVRQRARASASVTVGLTGARPGKRYNKHKEKKTHPWHRTDSVDRGQDEQAGKEEKALQRRLARDRKREEKRNALIALAQTEALFEFGASSETVLVASCTTLAESVADDVGKASALMTGVGKEADALAYGVGGLHAAVDSTVHGTDECAEASPAQQGGEVTEGLAGVVVSDRGLEREPRLIVEALVVRKMSIEEAMLDLSRLTLA